MEAPITARHFKSQPENDDGKSHNRLIHEKSPYLLQHASNPVNWYPWGDEAFARARKEDKPVFLSVGYSTCHWCHVMERESFEKEDVAGILNEHYICIKVDREERPDIDKIYMNATQLLTERGGWPNSVWLTPEGKPWYAGTYFPPEDRFGMPGFKTVLTKLAKIWRERRKDIERQALEISEAVKKVSSQLTVGSGTELTRELAENATERLLASFDKKNGGFGGAPKFPPHTSLNLLFSEYRRTEKKELLEAAARTLDAMALGGIRDHIGGGFHRYSTDERWFLPHFEKMLYDNAQLAKSYVEGYMATGNENYRHVAVEIYEWVLREMTDETGGFYSALDADSEGKEGRFYLWSREEILEILGEEEGGLFCSIYNLEEKGNFIEEATGEKPGTNILYLKKPVTDENLRARLEKARKKLLDRRSGRIRPHLDDKVLAGWNGLMIKSLAFGGKNLKEPRYVKAAGKAAQFIFDEMLVKDRLLHRYREGEAKLDAFLDDYAFLAEGLIELYEATEEKQWLAGAVKLARRMIELFHDETGGGFFFTPDGHENLLARPKLPFDGAIPSGNGAAAGMLVRLAPLTGDYSYYKLVGSTLEVFAGSMKNVPQGTETLIHALSLYLDTKEADGETQGNYGIKVRGEHIQIEASPPSAAVIPGQTFEVALRFTVDKGWHINSNSPLQDNLVPTEIIVEKNPLVESAGVDYPDGREAQFESSPELLSVYEGEFEIKAVFKTASNAQPGKAELFIKVKAQACSGKSCGLAQTYHLTVPVEVAKKIQNNRDR